MKNKDRFKPSPEILELVALMMSATKTTEEEKREIIRRKIMENGQAVA